MKRVEELNAYFDHNIAACAKKHTALLNDGRRDEAVFQQIRGNVFDIFRTVLDVAAKRSAGDEAEIRRFFRAKLAEIPAGWRDSYAKAEAHDDAVKLHQETVKLEAWKEISAFCDRIWGADE